MVRGERIELQAGHNTWHPHMAILPRFPQGLGTRTLDDILNFVAQNEFNALRLPVSLTLALNLDAPVGPGLNDPSLQGLNAVRPMS